LLEARQLLEESRDDYVDLYDFAPVAYATLTGEGRITRMNLAAAALLGLVSLIGDPFLNEKPVWRYRRTGFFFHRGCGGDAAGTPCLCPQTGPCDRSASVAARRPRPRLRGLGRRQG
jgi:hypothetical protein